MPRDEWERERRRSVARKVAFERATGQPLSFEPIEITPLDRINVFRQVGSDAAVPPRLSTPQQLLALIEVPRDFASLREGIRGIAIDLMERHAVLGLWRKRGQRLWTSDLERASEPIEMAALMKDLEFIIIDRSVLSCAWKARRNDWRKECSMAKSLAEVATLFVDLREAIV